MAHKLTAYEVTYTVLVHAHDEDEAVQEVFQSLDLNIPDNIQADPYPVDAVDCVDEYCEWEEQYAQTFVL